MVKTKLKLEPFQEKLGSWFRVLRPGIEDGLLDPVFAHLKSCPKGSVVPKSEDLFRAFLECPYDNLKAVILCNEPYLQGADGIALSAKNREKLLVLPEPLDYFYRAVERNYHDGLHLTGFYQNDLSFLSNQGVLLLNVALTRDGDNIHREIWKPLVSFVLSQISYLAPPVIFMGEECRAFEDCLTPWQERYFLSFPHSVSWSDEGVLGKVNEQVIAANGKQAAINWTDSLPF